MSIKDEILKEIEDVCEFLEKEHSAVQEDMENLRKEAEEDSDLKKDLDLVCKYGLGLSAGYSRAFVRLKEILSVYRRQ